MPDSSLPDSTLPEPGLHARLRAATADAHAGLEAGLDWRARVATRDGYRGLLARLHGIHAAWEPAIAAALADDAFLAPRLRLAHLRADLAWLGCDPASLPEPRPVALRSRAEGFGALYVLEGSTLGGQVILRHVARLHGITAQAGGSYYGGRGDRTGALWREFLAALEQCAGAAAAEQAARSAIAAFAAIRAWLATPIDAPLDGARPPHPSMPGRRLDRA